MFAQLGEIKFEVINYFESIQSSKQFSYSEHARIGRKPKLQFTGESLEDIPIRIKFHISFCNPEKEIKKLEEMSQKHQILPFIYGNGKYQGKYVITDITKTPVQTDNLGNILSMDAEIRLKECPEETNPSNKKAKAKAKAKAKTNSLPKKKVNPKTPNKITEFKKTPVVKGLDEASKKNLDKAIIIRKVPVEMLQKSSQQSLSEKMAEKMILKRNNPEEYNWQLTQARAIVNKEERQKKLLEFGIFEDANF